LEQRFHGFVGKECFAVFDTIATAKLDGRITGYRGKRLQKFLKRVIGGKIFEECPDWNSRVFQNRGASQNFRIDGHEVARIHGLAAGIFTVADSSNADDTNPVGDFIDGAVVSGAETPVVFRADKFPATGWTRIIGEITHRGGQLRALFVDDLLEILFRRTIYDDLEHGC
jgi:hypothetical protein